jgi:threonylcarbamoyladenosine tRNA methylthiotransferase MtaB
MGNLLTEFEPRTSSKKVALTTLGCKLNFSETSTIARKFKEAEYSIVDFDSYSDYYVINTCSVTDHADKKTKKFIKDAKELNPASKVIIIGCYAQLKPEEIASMEGVSMVLGANEKFNIVEHIAQMDLIGEAQKIILNTHIKEVQDFNPSYSAGDRTRSFLKVQDGCDYFCSFCTIPLARGRSRSTTIYKVVESANEISQQGIKEIVLTGVNIGDFANDQNESFLDLIQALEEVSDIDRFRISSIEPNLLIPEIIHFVSTSQKFVPHFHIPLQSGSDEMLKLMRRRYERNLYKERVALIKSLMPDACIGVDVIVGFPQETDAHFMETVDFLESLDVSYFHVFTYSERPNTTALRLKGKIPNRIRSERNAILTELSKKKKRAFYESQIGTTHQVLWESEHADGMMFGFTENYLRIKKPFDPASINQIEELVCKELGSDGVFHIGF